MISPEIINELNSGSLATKRTTDLIESARNKVNDLKEKIDRINADTKLSNTIPASASETTGDWTKIYSVCNAYEDLEDIKSAYDSETKRLQDLSENAMLNAHQHDHAEVLKLKFKNTIFKLIFIF